MTLNDHFSMMDRVAVSWTAAVRELNSRIYQGTQPTVSLFGNVLGDADFFNPLNVNAHVLSLLQCSDRWCSAKL